MFERRMYVSMRVKIYVRERRMYVCARVKYMCKENVCVRENENISV